MKAVPYPKPWDWTHEAAPARLGSWALAPEATGFYEIGFVRGEFQEMYCGRAAGVTLKARLRQHFVHSHNDEIRKHRQELWYRYKTLATFELACYVEAVHIAALNYPWNARNEWAKHWILEF